MSGRRNKLNVKQLSLLKLIYKFRFVNADLVARHKGMSRSAVNYSLAILLDQDLIGRRYGNSYRIAGKGAAYYLTPKALRLLKDSITLNEQVVRAIYKNKTVGEPFVDDKLTVMRAYLALRNSYPEAFNIFTPSELSGFSDLPEPKPSLYLSRKKSSATKHNDYVLDIIKDNRLFVTKIRVQQYIEHCESGKWGEGDYPTVLLVLPDSRAEEKVLKTVESLLEDFDIYTTTIKALLGSNNSNKAIWSESFEPDELISL